MKRNKTNISKALSYKEISDFWDKHDLSSYWHKTKEVDFEVEIDSEVTYYAIDQSLSEKIKNIADKRGISPDTLINLWIQEKLLKQKV